jgi:hypothetical protein
VRIEEMAAARKDIQVEYSALELRAADAEADQRQVELPKQVERS